MTEVWRAGRLPAFRPFLTLATKKKEVGMHFSFPRRAFTLVELLVVIAIMGILFGLIMAAVIQTRETANIVESKNNLHQIVLAVHNFATDHQGRVPPAGNGATVFLSNGTFVGFGKKNPSLFVQILPYLEQEKAVAKKKPKFRLVRLYLSPSDPTAAQALSKEAPVTSYAINAEAFQGDPRLSTTFPDGTSNTIAFAEHYSYDCKGFRFPYWAAGVPWTPTERKPTFADSIAGNVVPVTTGNPPITTGSLSPSIPVATFQTAPHPKDCYPAVAQTPHRSGMLVANVDGGVRQLSPSIAPTIFWGAVTPNQREVLGEW